MTHPRRRTSPGTGRRPRGAPLSRRIACGRRASAEILDEVDAFLHEARGSGRETLIELDDVGRIAGSASAFLKGLARLLADHPGPVTLRDRSGYADAFVQLWDLRPS